MIIGVLKEIKNGETRVGLVPSGVAALCESGHKVLVETHAGNGSFITDSEYLQAGADLLGSASEIWRKANLIVKVKEPQPEELSYLRSGLILFSYLHLAPLPRLTKALMDSGVTAVAYETIREADGSLPLLTSMSEVAGRLSVQIGAAYLQADKGGLGLLLGGVPGVKPAEVVILGGGVAGYNAARIAYGMGAHITILDRNLTRLRELDNNFHGNVVTLASNSWTIGESLRTADFVVGAVLIPGAFAPRLVSRGMVTAMKPGSVVVDVAIDQGGCFETSHPTTHSDPVFTECGVLHYCVTNIPALVPKTSTITLTNATLPYLLELANHGIEGACDRHPSLRLGINTHNGKIMHPAVAEALELANVALPTLS